MYFKHIATIIPEQERMALVRASRIEDIEERIAAIDDIATECRKKYPELYWTHEEEIAMAQKLEAERTKRRMASDQAKMEMMTMMMMGTEEC